MNHKLKEEAVLCLVVTAFVAFTMFMGKIIFRHVFDGPPGTSVCERQRDEAVRLMTEWQKQSDKSFAIAEQCVANTSRVERQRDEALAFARMCIEQRDEIAKQCSDTLRRNQ